MERGGGGRTWTNVPTLDAEFKSAKIQNSLCLVGGGDVSGAMLQLLILSLNLLKSEVIGWGRGGGGEWGYLDPCSNF